jgi:hypothetical protein
MMKTTRKRKANKAGRRTARTPAAHFLESNAGMAMRRGRETISRAYGWAHDAAQGAHLGNLRLPQRGDLSHLTQANPLLLGAVGLGLGVALGTLFPRGMGRRGRGGRPANGSAAPAKSARRRRRKTRTSAKARAGTASAS